MRYVSSEIVLLEVVYIRRKFGCEKESGQPDDSSSNQFATKVTQDEN